MGADRYTRLLQLLKAGFPHAKVELFDDSAAHAGHAHGQDGETHYRLRITDTSFHGKPRIAIHREILAAVKPETDAGMHSFVIESAGVEGG